MDSILTKEHMDYLANLSRLELSDEECVEIKDSLEKVIGYMDKLKNLNLKDVEPMMRVDEALKPLRKDSAGNSISREDTFKNAPEVEKGHFSIPKAI
jgi:aspartyl-tRNA(Asn)/glutamyl-tRNA(Gln) amidotransferase subunit C